MEEQCRRRIGRERATPRKKEEKDVLFTELKSCWPVLVWQPKSGAC